MTDISPTAWDWAAKGAGAVAGSAVSLAYVMPSGRREAAARFAGVVMGLIFGPTVGLKIAAEFGVSALVGTLETMLMGSAAASFCAWWALGLVRRMFEPGGKLDRGGEAKPDDVKDDAEGDSSRSRAPGL